MSRKIPLDSKAVFDRFFFLWSLIGISQNGKPLLNGAYNFVLTAIFGIYYPIHFVPKLYTSENLQMLASLGYIFVGTIASTSKHLVLRSKIKEMQNIAKIMKKLEQRMCESDERNCYLNALRQTHIVHNLFSWGYGALGISVVLTTLWAHERNMLYPGWYPCDYQTSLICFIIAFPFSLIGLFYHIIINLANDCYGALALCICAGHIHVLRIRLSKLGYETAKSSDQHFNDLMDCVKDHRDLMSMHAAIANVLSIPMSIQFFCTCIDMVFSIISLLYFSGDIFEIMLNVLAFAALIAELFPCCYFASVAKMEFNEIPRSLFCCNWIDQPKRFRKSIVVFTELCSKEVSLVAGRMVEIGVDSFFAAMRMAYSLFTLVLNMK